MFKTLFFFFFFFFVIFDQTGFTKTLLEDSLQFNNRKGKIVRSISTIDEVPIGTVVPWPVGDGSSEGFEVPPAWRICNGQSIQMSWYSRLPTTPENLQTKWYNHARNVIGVNLPNYNTSSAPQNKGVFLRGNTESSARYMITQQDMFRSHLHGQPEHIHPFDLDVENNQVAGQFEGQEHQDTVSRMRYGDYPLVSGTTARALEHINRGFGGAGGLYSSGAVSSTLSSGHRTTIPSYNPEISGMSASYSCPYGSHEAGITISQRPTAAYDVTIDYRKTGSAKWGMDSLGQVGEHGERPIVARIAEDGTYTGKINNKEIIGRIYEAGDEQYYTNDNYHPDGGKTRNEKETTPVYMNVLYIIKVLP